VPTSPRLLKPAEPSRHRTVAKSERERAEREQVRGSAASRGYDRKWRRFRAAWLAEHPLCVMCEAHGAVVAAEVVDHIVPHQGDRGLFWQDGNHQSLCKACHNRKTVMEDGGFNRGAQSHPEFLRPSLVGLSIVCGPPCSGKSTYVAGRAGLGDVVIDLDVIASEMAGTGLHEWPLTVLGEAIRERNRRLLSLSDPSCVAREAPTVAWFIVGEPSARRRAWWARVLQPREIVVLEVSRHVCAARAMAERSDWRGTFDAIDRWWREYQRRDGDVVVGNDRGA
jgi:5-methylcytosine-specific restriction endonuclease McrA